METKIALVCVVFALASVSANYYQLNIKENGRDYIEAIRTSAKENTVEMEMPAHEQRRALGVLNDFSTGFSVKKSYSENVCYITTIDPKFPRPEQTQDYMEKTGGQFQNAKYEVINVRMIPIRNMTNEEVGPRIAAFCYGFEMVLTAEFEKGDVDAEIGKLMRGPVNGGRAKRQAVIRAARACDPSSVMNMEKCPQTFYANCKWRASDCYYWITCDVDYSIGGYKCTMRHPLQSSLICCDYACP